METADVYERMTRFVERLHGDHKIIGQDLYDSCEGKFFPADMLAMAVLNRSLNLIKAFELLVNNGGFIVAAAILRMQLDNALRFGAVTSSVDDPHGVAAELLNGKKLSALLDKNKKLMKDGYLWDQFVSRKPKFDGIYETTSGYIHLSKEHVSHFIQRSPQLADGKRMINIGDEDDYLTVEQRLDLVESFAHVSFEALESVKSWVGKRKGVSTNDELLKRFGRLP